MRYWACTSSLGVQKGRRGGWGGKQADMALIGFHGAQHKTGRKANKRDEKFTFLELNGLGPTNTHDHKGELGYPGMTRTENLFLMAFEWFQAYFRI